MSAVSRRSYVERGGGGRRVKSRGSTIGVDTEAMAVEAWQTQTQCAALSALSSSAWQSCAQCVTMLPRSSKAAAAKHGNR